MLDHRKVAASLHEGRTTPEGNQHKRPLTCTTPDEYRKPADSWQSFRGTTLWERRSSALAIVSPMSFGRPLDILATSSWAAYVPAVALCAIWGRRFSAALVREARYSPEAIGGQGEQ